MEFGLQFFPDVGPDEKSPRDYWSECLHLAEVADRLGLHHVRTVEHYFHRYGGYSARARSCSCRRRRSAPSACG